MNNYFLLILGLVTCLQGLAQALPEESRQSVEERLEKLETRVTKLEEENKDKDDVIKSLSEKLEAFMEGNVRSVNSEEGVNHPQGSPYTHTGSYIAFYAMTTYQQVLSNNEVIQFRNVKYNLGGDYSSSTSKFTCPDFGLYAFFTTIMSADPNTNTYVRWKIVKNNVELTAGHTGYGHVQNMLMPSWGSAVTGSQMVVAQCVPNQKIWVKAWKISSGEGANNMKTFNRYSSFSGFKLR